MRKDKVNLIRGHEFDDFTIPVDCKTFKVTLYFTMDEWRRYISYCQNNNYVPLKYLKDRVKFG